MRRKGLLGIFTRIASTKRKIEVAAAVAALIDDRERSQTGGMGRGTWQSPTRDKRDYSPEKRTGEINRGTPRERTHTSTLAGLGRAGASRSLAVHITAHAVLPDKGIQFRASIQRFHNENGWARA